MKEEFFINFNAPTGFIAPIISAVQCWKSARNITAGRKIHPIFKKSAIFCKKSPPKSISYLSIYEKVCYNITVVKQRFWHI
jgi:hypothetical protein